MARLAAAIATPATIAAAMALSACVLPVAPDFQDPPLAPNYPPFFAQFDPYQDTLVTQLPQDFTVLLDDPNPQDTLYVRWAIDYPPYIQSRSLLLVDGKTVNPGELATFQIADCQRFKSGSGLAHNLVIIVADRPFLPIVQFQGFDRFNQSEDGQHPPIMAGWPVGCP